nr:hypothetical protein [Azospirillum sp. 412522]
MTILCITAATSILSLGLLAGFDLCIDLPANMPPDTALNIAGTRADQSNRRRSGEDMMG